MAWTTRARMETYDLVVVDQKKFGQLLCNFEIFWCLDMTMEAALVRDECASFVAFVTFDDIQYFDDFSFSSVGSGIKNRSDNFETV